MLGSTADRALVGAITHAAQPRGVARRAFMARVTRSLWLGLGLGAAGCAPTALALAPLHPALSSTPGARPAPLPVPGESPARSDEAESPSDGSHHHHHGHTP
ncbi:MAG: hypothetical protein IPI49_21015 [Myxococcales bacterium]|nr:hypothetical protein [Myxococcales bacterium]